MWKACRNGKEGTTKTGEGQERRELNFRNSCTQVMHSAAGAVESPYLFTASTSKQGMKW